MTLTPTQLLLLELLINNAIRLALDQMSNMNEDELLQAIAVQEDRKRQLLERLG